MTRQAELDAPQPGSVDRGRPATDEHLALAARTDIRHFERLYERYADRLYRYALGRTGSSEAAADIVSQTMIAAIEGLERFDPSRGSFAAWIFTIAGRRIADRHRAHRRFRRYLTYLWHPVGAEVNIVDELDRDVRRADVRAAVQRLSERHREVILLRHVAELSIAEIAATLDISEGAVKMRLNRARTQLAHDLGGDDDD